MKSFVCSSTDYKIIKSIDFLFSSSVSSAYIQTYFSFFFFFWKYNVTHTYVCICCAVILYAVYVCVRLKSAKTRVDPHWVRAVVLMYGVTVYPKAFSNVCRRVAEVGDLRIYFWIALKITRVKIHVILATRTFSTFVYCPFAKCELFTDVVAALHMELFTRHETAIYKTRSTYREETKIEF